MRKLFIVVAAVALSGSIAVNASASTISQFVAGLNSASTGGFFIGQSLTIAAGPSWNGLSFNFFSDTSGGTTPTAAGTVYLLTQEYLGVPGALSAATPGFLGASTSIVGNVYFFNPSLTIGGGAQYFFYANALVVVSGSSTGDAFAGGKTYFGSPFAAVNEADANFRLSGTAVTAVPEPGTLVLLASGLALGLRRALSRSR